MNKILKSKGVSKNQPWVDAVQFALEECVRYVEMTNEAVAKKDLSGLPGSDFLYELRAGDRRKWTYGPAAQRKLIEACDDALTRSRFSASLSLKRFFDVLQPRLVARFIDKGVPVTLGSVESMFAAALKEAAAQRDDSRHFIPCQLMFQPDPDHFSIGPVIFHNRKSFGPIADQLLLDLRAREAGEARPTLTDMLVEYYGAFTWVAEVTVLRCDEEIGKERAVQAVNAAVDFLRLLFGHEHSRDMLVGGPAITFDRRATLEVREKETKASLSTRPTSAVTIPDGWSSWLEDEQTQEAINAAGRAIEAITDPDIVRPLGLRLIDALSWYGQAVRETSAAGSIVKAVTALERLVTVQKGSNTTRIVTERNAAMSYDPRDDNRLDDLIMKMESIYDLRSRLAHGTLSPFDREVRNRQFEVLKAAGHSLINGLAFLDIDGAFDKILSRAEVTIALENLVSWARSIDETKAKDKIS